MKRGAERVRAYEHWIFFALGVLAAIVVNIIVSVYHYTPVAAGYYSGSAHDRRITSSSPLRSSIESDAAAAAYSSSRRRTNISRDPGVEQGVYETYLELRSLCSLNKAGGRGLVMGMRHAGLNCRCDWTLGVNFSHPLCAPFHHPDALVAPGWRWSMWNQAFFMIPAPCPVRFARPFCGQLLSVILFETRRKVTTLEPALRNVAVAFGHGDVSLYVWHALALAPLVWRVTSSWANVQRVMLEESFGHVQAYSRLMTSLRLTSTIPQKYLLVTQTDAMITKRVPLMFFAFNFVGAGWPHLGGSIGNGGLSLRRTDRMAELSFLGNGSDQHALPEDVWYSMRMLPWDVPDFACSLAFSQEHVPCPSSLGCHKRLDHFAREPCALAAYLCRVRGVMQGTVGFDPQRATNVSHAACTEALLLPVRTLSSDSHTARTPSLGQQEIRGAMIGFLRHRISEKNMSGSD